MINRNICYKINLKTSFLYLLFFVLLYNESAQIGGMPLSQLWKIPLLVYIAIFAIKRKWHRPLFNKYAYGYGFVKLLNRGIINTTFTTISDFSRYITFPLLYDYISSKIKNSQKAYNIIYHISQFTIISFIPFLLKILHSKKEIDANSSSLEIMEEAGRTSGIFGSSHEASSLLALCLVFMINHFLTHKLSKSQKIRLFLIFSIGLWALVSTYARGGWVMFSLGAFILIVNNQRNLVFGVFFLFFLYLGTTYLMVHNEYFYNRITDKNEQGIQNSSDRAGSGRLWFAENGINFWKESNAPYEFLFGKGMTELMEYQKKETGLYIYCHNGYIDALAQNGIVGFVCFIGYTVCALIFVIHNKRSPHRRFCITIIIMFIIFQLLQGGSVPYSDFFYAITLQLSKCGQLEIKN